MNTEQEEVTGACEAKRESKQLTCERCGNKTDGGVWLGFVYVGVECLTEADAEYLE